jgi:hypothetical protein
MRTCIPRLTPEAKFADRFTLVVTTNAGTNTKIRTRPRSFFWDEVRCQWMTDLASELADEIRTPPS